MKHLSFPSALRLHTLAALCAMSLLSACADNATDPVFKPIDLNIAHINDHHSNLEPMANTTLKIDGVDTQVDLGGFARVAAYFKSIENTPNLLKIHAGDAMTGSLYYTFYKGAADADLMNTVCFDAFTPGNHEFDDGDAALQGFLTQLNSSKDCKTAALSANIRPAVGTPLLPTADKPLLQPYAVKKMGGVDVGITGVTVVGKTKESSRPLATTVFDDEVASAQRAIDAMKAKGIRHIVVVSHMGYDADKALASQLTDVDAIIGGDSHTLLGDFSNFGMSATAGAYPTVAKNKDGHPVCIGQAWEYTKATGLMNIRFNDKGQVTSCSGNSRLLMGTSFRQKDAAGNWQTLPAASAEALLSRLKGLNNVAALPIDAAADAVLKPYRDRVAEQKKIQIGTAVRSLCLTRIPGSGDNRSKGVAGCEDADKAARGSDAAQVVAEAFLNASKRADIGLQNAGGVRTPISAGPMSMDTAFTVLPFTNVLVEMSLTGAQIQSSLEDAASMHLDATKPSDGPHPYAAALRWDLDMSQPKGKRFTNLQVRNRTTGAWTALDPAKTYVLVTNDFIAAGQDGYKTLGEVYKAGRFVNTYLLYTQSFVDHVKAKGGIDRPARSDYSHQRVINKQGVALPDLF